MKYLLKALVPEWTRPRLRRAHARIVSAGLARRCPVCGSFLRRFLPHGVPVEHDAVCPVCRSKAPHRLAMLFFQQNQHLFRPGLMLHIAPEPELGRRLEQWAAGSGMRYRGGGLNGTGHRFLDIMRLPCGDGEVGLIYCCHVLNSLQDDRAAMREVFRVLHASGTAVLQVPAFYPGAETLETHSLAERLRVFQDEGIFRCYTPDDYVRRLQEAGFIVETFNAGSLPDRLVRRHSLKNEVLHICRKPA